MGYCGNIIVYYTANQIAMIDSQKIISDLSLRNVILSESQVNEILNKLNLKKTLGYR